MSTMFVVMTSLAQKPVERIEPPCWWVGMNNPNLQLLVYGKNIASAQVSINNPNIDLV
ncbi:MAG: cyclomaltodextrinase N-terminal domain-containing protein, partial [Bacteroidales bacterium]|nr:cyclomaltodextrinase N-terminal domain-containing protein [Bacteroidales bacterium]